MGHEGILVELFIIELTQGPVSDTLMSRTMVTRCGGERGGIPQPNHLIRSNRPGNYCYFFIIDWKTLVKDPILASVFRAFAFGQVG